MRSNKRILVFIAIIVLVLVTCKNTKQKEEITQKVSEECNQTEVEKVDTNEVKEQKLKPFERNGFTAVEWGGTEIN